MIYFSVNSYILFCFLKSEVMNQAFFTYINLLICTTSQITYHQPCYACFVTIGRCGITMVTGSRQVFDAARRANAHDFICGFPDGYQTLVGERGHAVSGGQKQRWALHCACLSCILLTPLSLPFMHSVNPFVTAFHAFIHSIQLAQLCMLLKLTTIRLPF